MAQQRLFSHTPVIYSRGGAGYLYIKYQRTEIYIPENYTIKEQIYVSRVIKENYRRRIPTLPA